MKSEWRQLAPNELDHELIWLTMSLAGVGVSAAWLRAGFPWPRCLFHQLTGLPCLTCGMTRCAVAFFHADFAAAMQWNPIIFLSLCGISIFDLYAIIVLITAAPRLRIRCSPSTGKYARRAVLGALAVNWIYLLAHWRNFA